MICGHCKEKKKVVKVEGIYIGMPVPEECKAAFCLKCKHLSVACPGKTQSEENPNLLLTYTLEELSEGVISLIDVAMGYTSTW